MPPKFICIGAQKSGTSWLYSMLASNPQFSMLPLKELHYFDRSTGYRSPNILSQTRLVDRLRDLDWTRRCLKELFSQMRPGNMRWLHWWARYYFANYSDQWYLSLFDSFAGMTGDVTPSYAILDEADVQRMHALVPDVKIIFLIRNPIGRAWSMLRFGKKSGISLDVDDFDAFRRRIDSRHQELRSDYLRTIDLYSKYFEPGQILIGFYDAIKRDPDGLLGAICRHVGVEEGGFWQHRKSKVNVSESVDCPPQFRAYLESKYAGAIEELARRYGSYAGDWQATLKGESVEEGGGADKRPPAVYPQS